MAAQAPQLRTIPKIVEDGILDAHPDDDPIDAWSSDFREIYVLASRMISGANGVETSESLKGTAIKAIIQPVIPQTDITYQKYIQVLMSVDAAWNKVYQTTQQKAAEQQAAAAAEAAALEAKRRDELQRALKNLEMENSMRTSLGLAPSQTLNVSSVYHQFSDSGNPERARKFVFSQKYSFFFGFTEQVGAFFTAIADPSKSSSNYLAAATGNSISVICRAQGVANVGNIDLSNTPQQARDELQILLRRTETITIIISEDDPAHFAIKFTNQYDEEIGIAIKQGAKLNAAVVVPVKNAVKAIGKGVETVTRAVIVTPVVTVWDFLKSIFR
jgi:hypothetical protein